MLLAIDFGTSRTRAAIRISGPPQPVILSESEESPDMPSAVFVAGEGKIFVGERARRERLIGGEDVATRYFARREFKLDIGNPIQPLIGKGEAAFSLPRRELVAAILSYCKQKAESQFPEAGSFSTLVLTVPAMYTPGGPAWKVMEEAGRSLDIPDVQLISEPHAAALYYGDLLRRASIPSSPGELTLIYDLGGGTFDPAIVASAEEGFRVLHLGGESEELKLGGTMIDDFLDEDFAARFPEAHQLVQFRNKKEGPVDETKEARKLRLQREIDYERFLFQTVKHGMASNKDFEECEPLLDESYVLTTKRFSDLIDERLIEQTARCCEALLQRTGTDWAQIRRIVMVGGTCRLPVVRQKLQQLGARNGVRDIEILWRTVGTLEARPELAVALGAAVSNRATSNTGSSESPSSKAKEQASQSSALQVLPQVNSEFEFKAVSPNGKWLVTFGQCTIKLWNLETLQIRRQSYTKAQPTRFSFSSDSHYLTIFYAKQTLIWNVLTGFEDLRDSVELVSEENVVDSYWSDCADLEKKIQKKVLSPDSKSQLIEYQSDYGIDHYRILCWKSDRWQSKSLDKLPTGEDTDLFCFFGGSQKVILVNRITSKWALWDNEAGRFIDAGRFKFGNETTFIMYMYWDPALGQSIAVNLGDWDSPGQLALCKPTTGLVSKAPTLSYEFEAPKLLLGHNGVEFQSASKGRYCFVKRIKEPASMQWGVEFHRSCSSIALAPKKLSALYITRSGGRFRYRENVLATQVRELEDVEMESGGRIFCESPKFSSSGEFATFENGQTSFLYSFGETSMTQHFPGSYRNATFSPDGDAIAFSEYDKQDRQAYIHCFDLTDFPQLERNARFAAGQKYRRVSELAWAAESNRVFVAIDDNRVACLLVGEPLPQWEEDFESTADNLTVSPCGRYLAFRTEGKTIVLDPKSGRRLTTRDIAPENEMVFNDSGEFLVQILPTGAVRVSHLFEEIDLTLFLFQSGFIAYDDNGQFDASPELLPFVSIDTGERLLTSLNDLKPYYRPDVVKSILDRL